MLWHAVDVVYGRTDWGAIRAPEVAVKVADGVAFGGFTVAAGKSLRAGAEIVEVFAAVMRVESAATVDNKFDRYLWRRLRVVGLRRSVGRSVNQSRGCRMFVFKFFLCSG